MELKKELIGQVMYCAELDRNIEINEENKELLASLKLEVFEIEEKPKKK